MSMATSIDLKIYMASKTETATPLLQEKNSDTIFIYWLSAIPSSGGLGIIILLVFYCCCRKLSPYKKIQNQQYARLLMADDSYGRL